MIWVSGTTEKNEEYPRQSLKTRDWPTAEARVRAIDAGGKDEGVYGPTIEECRQKYLDSREDEIGARTLSQFKLILGNLHSFAASRGCFHMRDLNADLLADFKTYDLAALRRDRTRKAGLYHLRRTWIQNGQRGRHTMQMRVPADIPGGIRALRKVCEEQPEQQCDLRPGEPPGEQPSRVRAQERRVHCGLFLDRPPRDRR
ncbi:MAG TPA: hypothetical protein VGM43_27585 [Bryobacteraceae bacterium]